MINSTYLKSLLESLVSKDIPGVVLSVSSGSELFIEARGNLKAHSQYFIASATKLYITALVLQLADSKKLRLDDKLLKFLPSEQLSKLHVFGGYDYTSQLTIEHLLSHTSGLPDYFQAVRSSKKSLMDHIFSEDDQKWDLSQVIEDSKKIGAVFAPSSAKALYSDTNFQLLGAIIESIEQKHLAEVIDQRICKRIGLEKTYLYMNEADATPMPLNYKRKVLNIPKAMASFGADGGIVSTASDGVRFLKGFFEGELFSKSHLEYLTFKWRNIFYPLKYGVGISLFRLPWYFSPFKRVPDLIGHSGLSGAFLFYCPSNDTYLSGTVNQISNPHTSYKLMVKTILSCSK